MKYGFTLIELVISTLIASMIGGVLLTALYQGSRFQARVDDTFDASLRVAIVSNQLEKDFMGAFVPTQARIKEAQEEAPEKITDKDAGKKQVSQPEEKKEKMSKPAEKPIEKIFYGTTKGPNVDILTFITNNPLLVYVSKDVGVVKPKIVRVQYVLKADASKDIFTLFRQESTEIDLAKYGQPRMYEVINDIKEFSVTYTAKIDKSTQTDQKKGATSEKQPAQKQPKVYEYKTSKEWVSERPQENKQVEAQEQEYPRIPYLIEIKMVLWNKQHTKTQEFVLSFELPVDTSPVKEKGEEEAKETQKTSDKSKEQQKTDKSSTAVDKNKQVHNDKNELVDSLTATLGNITKILSTL